MRQGQQVLSCRLKAGLMEVRAIADQPPPSMSVTTPTLEDVYFATLQQHGLAANLE